MIVINIVGKRAMKLRLIIRTYDFLKIVQFTNIQLLGRVIGKIIHQLNNKNMQQ